MATKTVKTRLQNKHDLEVNWNSAAEADNPFIPLIGEIIVYDADDNYPYERFKIGDGIHNVKELSFATADITRGEADYSIVQFNLDADIPNKAYATNGSALGTGTTVGTMGYRVVDAVGNRDQAGHYVLEERPEALIKYIETQGYDSADCAALKLAFSIYLQYNGYSYGNITKIEDTKIYVDKMFYAPNWETRDDAWKTEYFGLSYLYIPSEPTIGTLFCGSGAHAEGYQNKAILIGSHAEGAQNTAEGKYSHAEGRYNYAGYAGHAEGYQTKALDQYSHSEGYRTEAVGEATHAEGYSTKATGKRAHSEGMSTEAKGDYSHAAGEQSIAEGRGAYAQGYQVKAEGEYSHAHGYKTLAQGAYATAEGEGTQAIGYAAHAEGTYDNNYGITVASGKGSHAEGTGTFASGISAHSEGNRTQATGEASHAEGHTSIASGDYSHAENAGMATAPGSHAEGSSTTEGTSYYYLHAEGNATVAKGGHGAHSEGQSTLAEGQGAHAEGFKTRAIGKDAHAEGNETYAVSNAHAEGSYNYAVSTEAHAEGYGTYHNNLTGLNPTNLKNLWLNTALTFDGSGYGDRMLHAATGSASHVEGRNSLAAGSAAHAEGRSTGAIGDFSHSEGYQTLANATASHASGIGTVANNAGEFVAGKYNIDDNDTSKLFVVGNGSAGARSDAFVVHTDGRATLGKDPEQPLDATTKSYVDKLSTDHLTDLNAHANLNLVSCAKYKHTVYYSCSANSEATYWANIEFILHTPSATPITTGSQFKQYKDCVVSARGLAGGWTDFDHPDSDDMAIINIQCLDQYITGELADPIFEPRDRLYPYEPEEYVDDASLTDVSYVDTVEALEMAQLVTSDKKLVVISADAVAIDRATTIKQYVDNLIAAKLTEHNNEVSAHPNFDWVLGDYGATSSRPAGELAYELSDDETYYIVTGRGKVTSSEIVIPDTYNNKPICMVARNAFSSNCADITKFTTGRYCYFIGSGNIEKMTNLQELYIGLDITTMPNYDDLNGFAALAVAGYANGWCCDLTEYTDGQHIPIDISTINILADYWRGYNNQIEQDDYYQNYPEELDLIVERF